MTRAASNLTNQQFGQLLALHPTDKRSQAKSIIWNCKCLNCGQEKEVSAIKLKNKEVRSCGCMEHVREYRTPKGSSGFNSLFCAYKKGAIRRGLEFNLTKKEVKDLVSQDCTYCGIEPRQVIYGSRDKAREHGKFIYNGIDRVNSSLGYSIENCVTCCIKCNRAKMALSESEFITLIAKIYRHLNLHDLVIQE